MAGTASGAQGAEGSLLWSNDWSGIAGGNINQGIVEFPAGSDEWYLFYHSTWLSGKSKGWERNVGVDRLYFNDSDHEKPTMLPVTATPGWLRAAVAYLSPFVAAAPAFTMAQASEGVFTRPSGDSGVKSIAAMLGGAKQLCIDGIRNGAWTLTRQVDFGMSLGGSSSQQMSLVLRVMVAPFSQQGGCPRISLHLDQLISRSVVYCQLNSTDSQWRTVVCPVEAPSAIRLHGVHDLWIEFEGVEAPTTLLAVSWWQVKSYYDGYPVSARKLAAARMHTSPTKAAIPLIISSIAAGGSVAIRDTGPQGAVLVAGQGTQLADLALHDNEDGTWAIEVKLGPNHTTQSYACATPKTGLVTVIAATSRANCTQFRVQVMADGYYALRSTALGLWITVSASAAGGGGLVVASPNPRRDPGAVFNFTTLLGLPPR